MLYRFLYIPAKFACWIFCRHIAINHKKILDSDGPLLIAANHPNSFLDAIILSVLFKRPVYSLARGDAFTKPLYKRLLLSLNMFPVYRISEGVENLETNYETFESCKELFKKNGIVLIFSEGRCINEWKLRPLKKGTARLAISSWQDGIPLKILPAGINYQSFTSFGKNMQLNFGAIIHEQDIPNHEGYGKTINEFNDVLKKELQSLTIEVEKATDTKLIQQFYIRQPILKKILLFIPAALGFLIHAPLYVPVRYYCWKHASKNDHYDSLMMGLLFILYPFYLVLFCLLAYFIFGGGWWLLVFILLPFCAWSFVQLKRQF